MTAEIWANLVFSPKLGQLLYWSSPTLGWWVWSPTFGQLFEKNTAKIWAVILRKKSAQLLANFLKKLPPIFGPSFCEKSQPNFWPSFFQQLAQRWAVSRIFKCRPNFRRSWNLQIYGQYLGQPKISKKNNVWITEIINSCSVWPKFGPLEFWPNSAQILAAFLKKNI